ncbi:MAG: RsmD family RNA methyltransferase [Candidatus Krumholzibacteriia bacterium]
MRITGGQWRGRRLVAAKGSSVRPTTDRAREALFAILRHDIPGAMVYDLCCGTGALGLEALSRGARFVHFVDVAAAALRTVAANLAACEVEPQRYAVHRADAARWFAAHRADAPETALVVLADPPYGGPVPAALWRALADGPLPAVFVLEHADTEPVDPPVGCDCTFDRRRYGTTAFTIIRPAGADPAEDVHG